MVRPPLWATSREIVEGARPRRMAISLKETPSASPLDISSRSSSDSTRSERSRGRGRIPPEVASMSRTDVTPMPRDLATAGQSRPAPSKAQALFFVASSMAPPSSGESRCNHPLNSPSISHHEAAGWQVVAAPSLNQAQRGYPRVRGQRSEKVNVTEAPLLGTGNQRSIRDNPDCPFPTSSS